MGAQSGASRCIIGVESEDGSQKSGEEIGRAFICGFAALQSHQLSAVSSQQKQEGSLPCTILDRRHLDRSQFPPHGKSQTMVNDMRSGEIFRFLRKISPLLISLSVSSYVHADEYTSGRDDPHCEETASGTMRMTISEISAPKTSLPARKFQNPIQLPAH